MSSPSERKELGVPLTLEFAGMSSADRSSAVRILRSNAERKMKEADILNREADALHSIDSRISIEEMAAG